MNHSPHLRFVLALTTCLTLGLAACSKDKPAETTAQGSPQEFLQAPSEYDESKFVPDGTKSADGQVTKDFAKRTLPSDSFANTDYTSEVNANNLFMHYCLKEKGVDSPKPKPDPTFKHQPDQFENPVSGEYIFNEQSAARDGYQHGSGQINIDEAADTPEDPFDTFMYKYLGGGDSDSHVEVVGGDKGEQKSKEQQNYEDCNNKFYQEFKKPGANYTQGNFPTLEEQKKDPTHFTSVFATVDTPYIREKAKEWKACMQPVGIPDLPDSPYDMPPPSKEKAWHPENGAEENGGGKPIDEKGNTMPKEADITESQLSDEEKAIATKDAQCRESSGWARAVYDTRWGLIADHMKENESEIKQFQNEQKAYIEKLKDYVEKN